MVFPGATLTISAGTVIEFAASQDRHQFSAGGTGVDDRTEIFVYGTLVAKGTATDSVRFQKSGTAGGIDAWGGIRKMDGGSVILDYTEIRDTLPGPPTDLQAERGDAQATLRWTRPNHFGITGWKYRSGTMAGTDTTWAAWQAMDSSDGDTDYHSIEDLVNGTTYTFQVRAVNPTGDGPSSGASAAVIPAGPPAPPEVTVGEGHEKVVLSWTPGDANGSAIQRHELRYSGDGGTTWNPDWRTHSVRSDTIGNLINDTEYTFQMRGRNEVDYSEVVEVKATPRHPIRGRAAISFPEHSTATVATYRFRAPAIWPELALAYGLEVVDYEDGTHFQLDDGRLRFRAAPDFEGAGDVNGDNVYGVRLRAAPASGPLNPRRPPPPTFSKRVEVTVTNVEEPGTVALSPATAPRVGTAVTATLRDPDSGLVVRREDWQWQSRAPGSTTWTTISGMTAGRSVPPSPESAEQSSYTPRPADAGQVLRAVVNHYEDGHGPGKRAVSGETDPVRANGPTKPRDFTADPGDRRVTLSWSAPESNRGATITGYAYRYTQDENTRDQTSWTAGTLGVTTRHLITGLDNGTPYTFELWALNPAAGDAAPAQATPAGPFTLAAAGRDEYVSLSWTPAPVSGPPVRYYSYRRSNDGGSTWTRWSSMWARLPGYPADPLFYQVQNLTNDVEYLFEVQAFNANGQVGEASAPATPTATPGDEIQLLRVSYGTDSYQATEGDSVAVEVRLSPAADRAVDIAITVTADAGTESGDYRVSGLSPGDTLPFAENSASETFHIVALTDTDTDDETVTLGFGAKPPGVLAGTTSSTTVTLVDTTGTSSPFDLVVESPSVTDSRPAPGASFTLSATVRNQGSGSSAATTLRYYRSTDGTITTGDTQVGTDAVSALAASGTSAESIGLTAPSTAGTYYYGACVVSVSGESNTGNNCSSAVTVTVVPPDTPDLVVGAPSVTDSRPAPGASFTLSATVRNQGSGSSATTTLRYYRSTDGTISTSDTEVGTDGVSALAASGTSAESIGLTAPSTAGTYYYGACVVSVSDESNTGNNCSSAVTVTVVPPSSPDLVVESPSVTDSRPGTGASFTLSATVRNQGTGSSAATTLRYYRSTDGTITTGDTQVGTDAVSALAASGTSAESIALTAPSTAGTYYYGACVVAVSGESNTGNNCSSAVTVTVVPPDTPDLVVESPSVTDSSPAPGASFTLSATVRNQGTGSSAATTLRYYRSTNTTISTSDTQVGTDGVSALAASGTSAESIALTAPSTAGTYYYGACVVVVSGESNTGNNCSSAVTVTVVPPSSPDLVVGAPSVTDSRPAPGASFTLSATVRNQGSGSSAATTLRYYRSTNTTISTSDTQVGTDGVSALAASGTSAESIALTAPSTAGTYYYGACVVVVSGESNTGNNCSSAVTVTVVPPSSPDLVVGAPSVTDSRPAPGASFTLSATVRNQGSGSSAATTLRYYRSTNTTISTSDTEVGRDEVSALAASATSAESIGLTAPTEEGTYYYGACVVSVSDESDTGNNCSGAVTVTVVNSPPEITSGAGASVPEGTSGVVYTGTATDPDGDTVTWSKRDHDHADFNLDSSSGALSFGTAPDHEKPHDGDTNNLYKVTLVATDPKGASDTQLVTITVEDVDGTPTVTGPGSITKAEKSAKKVAAYTVSDPDPSETFTNGWSVEGTYATSFFEHKAGSNAKERELHFLSSPDYETRRSYTVDVKATNSEGRSDHQRVTITLENVDDGGTVTVSPSTPVVGEPVTATLIDEDGGVVIDPDDASHGWTWTHVDAPPGARYPSIRTETYTPTGDDVDYRLRVTVDYDDAQGPGKSAWAVTTNSVQAVLPGPPQGVGTARTGRSLTVSWSAAEANGSPIQRYEVNELEGITWLGWTSAGISTSYTKKGVSDSRSYTFAVRAVNGVGAGPSVEVTSPPLGPGGNSARGDTAAAAKTLATLASPAGLAIFPAPNPFNPSTILYLRLPEEAPVSLIVYNVAGQPVAVLVDEPSVPAGLYSYVWDGLDRNRRPAASGLYLFRLIAGHEIRVGKMALIR